VFVPVRVKRTKPVINGRFCHSRRFICQNGVVGAVIPGAKVVDEAVGLRVAVDVGDQVEEVAVLPDFDTAEGVLKQGSGTAVSFIDSFCVRVKQVGKILAWGF
jgi:hypothetical protein